MLYLTKKRFHCKDEKELEYWFHSLRLDFPFAPACSIILMLLYFLMCNKNLQQAWSSFSLKLVLEVAANVQKSQL